MDGSVLFAWNVQLRIYCDEQYTNVRFTGWMTWNGQRFRVCQFENGWQSWFLVCIHTFIMSCLQMWMPSIFFFKLLHFFYQHLCKNNTWSHPRRTEEEITELAYQWVGPITRMHFTANKWQDRPYFEWPQWREWKQIELHKSHFQPLSDCCLSDMHICTYIYIYI